VLIDCTGLLCFVFVHDAHAFALGSSEGGGAVIRNLCTTSQRKLFRLKRRLSGNRGPVCKVQEVRARKCSAVVDI